MPFLQMTVKDWPLFLEWAEAEDWTIPAQELRLFQNQWGHCFHVLKVAGDAKGFVSAVAYEECGWIGNLLVGQDQRGRGYGAALFDFALSLLVQKGLRRIWLTASGTGLPIYQRRGFVTVDRIDRWHARGRGRSELSREFPVVELLDLDRRCWGESRAGLLSLLAEKAEICLSAASIALLQPSLSCWQLGPWLAFDNGARETGLILNEALNKTPAGTVLLADVLASAKAETFLHNAGFVKAGANMLMCLTRQSTSIRGVLALASLGSIG